MTKSARNDGKALGMTRGARPERRATPYWNIPKFPSSHQRIRKMMIVLKHPPPSFFAPYPAASPRNSLLIDRPPENSASFRPGLALARAVPESCVLAQPRAGGHI